MKPSFKLIHDAINEERLYKQVKEISCFHRIQASTTFRKAANHVVELAKSYGLTTELLEYPATGENWYLENKMFKEWDIKEATLDLVEPDIRLCDFSACNISVIQKSYPVDHRNDPVELIYLDKGSDPSNYTDLDLTGKMIFARTWHDEYKWAYEKGAIGILTDFVRTDATRSRHDQYHIRTYTSFWHNHGENEPKKFGFVITPQMGDQLAELFEKNKKDHKPVMVKPYVNSSLYDGAIEVVVLTIPGKDDKKVLMTAHLCHPNPSCNDNTSGVSATLEAMHVIDSLIKEGKIEKPQHTIQCILMPDFPGTYAYMSDHLDNDIIGAINLDMVGARQDRTNGPITLTMLPWSTPSIINELSTMALAMAGNESVSHDGHAIPLTNSITDNFSGGSDHVFYSDPTINIPCCMLGQWPDRFYHTSGDTLEVIDPAVLKFSSMVAASFTYMLATLSAKDLPAIINEMGKNLNHHMSVTYDAFLNGKIDSTLLAYKFNAFESFYSASVENIASLIDIEPSWIDTTKTYMVQTIHAYRQFHHIPDIHHDVSDTRVFKRNFVGPIYSMDDYAFKGYRKQLDEFFSKVSFSDGRAIRMYAMEIPFFIDGKRTVDQICEMVSAQINKTDDHLVKSFVDCLESIDLIRQVN